MLERWLMKKVANRLEEKAPGSGLGEAVETMQSQVASGESGSILVTRDGHVTHLESQEAAEDHAADQLARLAALHDRGALTDAEFEAQKHQITGT